MRTACQSLSVEVEAVDHATKVLVVHGEADILTAPHLAACLHAVVVQGPERLVIDLADMSFLDCAGARAIAGAQKHLSAQGGQLLLRRPRPIVRKVLDIMGLDGPYVVDA
jgi:anti-anti-sigma factor